MTCDFTYFSTVFQSCKDNGQMIKDVCNGTLFTVKNILLGGGCNSGLLDQ